MYGEIAANHEGAEMITNIPEMPMILTKEHGLIEKYESDAYGSIYEFVQQTDPDNSSRWKFLGKLNGGDLLTRIAEIESQDEFGA